LFFLGDFQHLIKGVDPTYYLMLDTIVASQGRTFIGTWRSTFTGYITRLRGYYGFPSGFSWYYYNERARNFSLTPLSPFYMREWPQAWEGID
ncbi:unnamed protein product, partial [Discosporangium mesarthrocarpum]